MIERLIHAVLKNRGLGLLALVGIVALGFFEYQRLEVEAFPDISPVMVPVFAEAEGLAPEEVEQLVASPIETAMNALPNVTLVKSTSAFGMAVVYVYFTDDTDIYFARQLVSERLASAVADLPDLREPPTLGPISSGLGQVFLYYLELEEGADTGGLDPLVYLRDLNDWVVKRQLQMVPGVTDILSAGGHVLLFQVQLDPYRLHQYELSIEDVITAIQTNNRNVGGQYLPINSEEHLVRGIGLLRDLDDIRGIALKTVDGTPVTIGDVGEVVHGKALRRGVVMRDSGEEVVSGIVMKLFGSNSSEVIDALYKKVEQVQAGLPEGVRLVPYYEQADLVDNALTTVQVALLQGMVLVLLVLFAFLGSARAAIIVSLAMPFCALVAFIGMKYFNISANLMSLGGIAVALGVLVDGSIVVSVGMASSIALSEAQKTMEQIAGKVMKVKGVSTVITRIGRPEAGSHPHPVNFSELHVEIKKGADKSKIVSEIRALMNEYPGVTANLSQTIQNQFDELLSGVKAQLAIKVYGEELEEIREAAEDIRGAISGVEGLVDLSVEQSHGQPQVQVLLDHDTGSLAKKCWSR